MSIIITRRMLLGAFAAAAAAGAIGGPARAAVPGESEIFTELRLRYRDTLVGPADLDTSDPVIAQEALDLGALMDKTVPLFDRGNGRDGVFKDLPIRNSPKSSVVTDTFKRLLQVATAWAVPGHKWSGSDDLAKDLVEGMRTVNVLAYAAGNPEWDNWWDWELGSPSRIGKILVIAYDVMPQDIRQAYVDAVGHYATPGYMYPRDSSKFKPATGSNLLNICLGAAIVGIVGGQGARLAEVQKHAPLGIGYNLGQSDTSDGLYPDGSYLQHETVAYTGTYGASFLGAVGEVVALVGGSPWSIESEGMGQLLDGVEHGFAPVIFDGLMMDFVSGREVSYSDRHETTRGRGAVMNIIQFSYGAGPERRMQWLGMAKGWIERSAYSDLSKPTSISSVPTLKTVLAPNVTAVNEPEEVVIFPVMDRAVHRRPGWAVSLSMSSPRTARFEVTNRENLRPWHQSAGMLAMYLTGDVDGQRSSGYWPTIDPYRLSGTTVDSARQPHITATNLSPTGFGRTAFSSVGGPLQDRGRQRGRYGAAFNEEQGYNSTMRVNQSWFMLDDGVVCLGAGITGGGAPVETVLENRRVAAEADRGWAVDGSQLAGSGEKGFAAVAKRPRSLVLEGAGGYVFLHAPEVVHLIRESRKGTWRDLKETEGTALVTRTYATAWIDHGENPQDASYAYVLLPGADHAATKDFSNTNKIAVVANTRTVQAIQDSASGYIGANFGEEGNISAGKYELGVDAAASVSLLEAKGQSKSIEISVGDPARGRNEIGLSVTLPTGQNWQVVHADPGVEAVVGHKTLQIIVTGDGSGNSRRVLLCPA